MLVLDTVFNLTRAHRFSPGFSPVHTGMDVPEVMAQAAGIVQHVMVQLVVEAGNETGVGVFVLPGIGATFQAVE